MHRPLPSVIALARFSFTPEQLEVAKDALLHEQNWQEWINQIELHGLSGFANKYVDEYDLPIPDAVRMPLKALKIRHQSAGVARYKTLGEIHKAFQTSGIPYVALKGAALAPYLYKEEYLRPMRDMDLLLPRALEQDAAQILRDIGFDLPHEQPSKFMRDMHQLPNAEKKVDGFVCSVELHRDGISREVTGHFYYPDSEADLQSVAWNDLTLPALEDVKMLHQVCRHLEGLHSGAVLKLINVMDVIGLAQMVLKKGNWQQLELQYPHVINSLKCLHLLTPLPNDLQQKLRPLPEAKPANVGQIMGSMKNALLHNKPFTERVRLLFRPSDWWLHLYYNVSPDKSLFLIKWIKHPMRVANWLSRRLYSRLLGG